VSFVLERSYERTVRVEAPLRGLYREMDTVEALARFLPQVDRLIPGSDADHAACEGSISIGPLSYRLQGTLSVERVDPPRTLRVRLRAPAIHLELDGEFDFTASAEEETTLRYAAMIRSSHPLVRRMRSSLTGALEEHVDSAIDLVAVRGRQYAEAERRLSNFQQRGNE
jgi:carbon monoxide dehydrogenase subunit G